MIKEVIKRDGRKVPFDVSKIENAIMQAAEASGGKDRELARQLAFKVCDELEEKYGVLKGDKELLGVEDIQNCIERVLIEAGHATTAKAFILYRAERDRIREAQSDLMKTIGDLTEKDSKDMDNKRENANINADTAMGSMLKFGSESAKAYNLANLITREYSEAHKNGDIHIHDLDFYSLTETCIAYDTKLVIKEKGEIKEITAKELWLKIAQTGNENATEKWIRPIWKETEQIEILSTGGKFVKIKGAKQLEVKGREKVQIIDTVMSTLRVTDRHKIPVLRNNVLTLVEAREIETFDNLLYIEHNAEPIYVEVQSRCIDCGYANYVYDFETEDHYFVANGILVHNCCQIDLTKLFTNGFSTGHGYLREPNDIKSYSALACIAIQSNQNDQHGGQSVPKFDYDMAKGVAKTFCKEFKRNLKAYLGWQGTMTSEIINEKLDIIDEQIRAYIEDNKGHIMNDFGYAFVIRKVRNAFDGFIDISDEVFDKLIKDTVEQADKETHQAMEALVHNLNTMQCLPSNATFWVYDNVTHKYKFVTMQSFYETFEKGRYSAISLNTTTKKLELKEITNAIKKGKAYKLCELNLTTGQSVTTTENHEILTFNDEGTDIITRYPNSCNKALVFKEIGTKDIFNLSDCDINSIIPNKFEGEYEQVQVEGIKEKEGEFEVYDISVADNENFLTGDGIFVHNCRAGAQVPFSSINLGTDTSTEGRMVTKNLLLAMEEGLGNGETPIFPIVIFKVKDGVNYEEGTPNHDLLELSLRVTAKRMFPKQNIGACA